MPSDTAEIFPALFLTAIWILPSAAFSSVKLFLYSALSSCSPKSPNIVPFQPLISSQSSLSSKSDENTVGTYSLFGLRYLSFERISDAASITTCSLIPSILSDCSL